MQALADYLQLHRSLGDELVGAPGGCPAAFPSFLATHDSRMVTIELALGWGQQSTTENVITIGVRRMTAVRGFARYLPGMEADAEVPPVTLRPRPLTRISHGELV